MVPGRAKDIGIGANGDVWTVGARKAGNEGYFIYKYSPQNRKWKQYRGIANRISVDGDGNPWGV